MLRIWFNEPYIRKREKFPNGLKMYLLQNMSKGLRWWKSSGNGQWWRWDNIVKVLSATEAYVETGKMGNYMLYTLYHNF